MTLPTLDDGVSACLRGYEAEVGDPPPTVRGELLFPADFAAFQGHFPERPVLPAIVQLAAVRLLVAKAVGQSLVPTAVHRIKFRGIIQPNDTATVTVHLQAQEEGWHATFTVVRQGETVTSGRADFARS